MNPRVKSAKPLSDYKIDVTFSNDENGIFDLTKYLDFGVFKELLNEDLFKNFKIVYGTIEWATGQDLCPDTIYLESIKN